MMVLDALDVQIFLYNTKECSISYDSNLFWGARFGIANKEICDTDKEKGFRVSLEG